MKTNPKKSRRRRVGLTRTLAYYEHPDTGRPYKAVTIGMDRHYWKFFKEAQKHKGDHISKFEAGLRSVVWGALCLETTLNNRCARALARLLNSDRSASAIWEALRRAGWDLKLELLARLAKRPRKMTNKMRGKYQKVVQFRNRLVHFYDRPTPVNHRKLAGGKLSPIDFFHELYPTTSIEKELTGPELKEFRRNVAQLRQWIDRVIPAVLAGEKVKPREEGRWLGEAIKDVESVQKPPAPPTR
jgi:hypothetical protein